MDIQHNDGIEFLQQISNKSIDLILTDPPYIISKDTGMNTFYKNIKQNKKDGIEFVKTNEDWNIYKKTLQKPQHELEQDKGPGWSKENYLKYGTILGNKYGVQTQYGKWDSEFTMQQLEQFICEFYKKLRDGGTLILWCDLWKITTIREIFEKYKFKQIRMIEWIKTNPQPINSKINYLTNCREVAILGVKKGKPTFHSKYDTGIYKYPMASGKDRFHPTQKNLQLFKDIIQKHSNENDIVLDTFLGGGTTAIACKHTNRICKGCDINQEYIKKINNILQRNGL